MSPTGNTTRLGIRVSIEADAAIRRLAQARGVSPSKIVEDLALDVQPGPTVGSVGVDCDGFDHRVCFFADPVFNVPVWHGNVCQSDGFRQLWLALEDSPLPSPGHPYHGENLRTRDYLRRTHKPAMRRLQVER